MFLLPAAVAAFVAFPRLFQGCFYTNRRLGQQQVCCCCCSYGYGVNMEVVVNDGFDSYNMAVAADYYSTIVASILDRAVKSLDNFFRVEQHNHVEEASH